MGDGGEAADAEANRQMPEGEATRVVPYDLQEEEDAHFRHVFDDFVETKRSCGEPTAGLTQAKFLQKLRDNKSALVAKHACRTVRFSVYVKDGKAALRARHPRPIRECRVRPPESRYCKKQLVGAGLFAGGGGLLGRRGAVEEDLVERA